MNNKFTYILELTWAVVALTAFVLAMHSTFRNGFSHSIGLYSLSLVALVMFLIRRQQRLTKKNNIK